MAELDPSTGDIQFTTRAYTYEITQLMSVVRDLDPDVRDAISGHITRMSTMLRPIVTEYLVSHPEADQREEFVSDLLHGRFGSPAQD